MQAGGWRFESARLHQEKSRRINRLDAIRGARARSGRAAREHIVSIPAHRPGRIATRWRMPRPAPQVLLWRGAQGMGPAPEPASGATIRIVSIRHVECARTSSESRIRDTVRRRPCAAACLTRPREGRTAWAVAERVRPAGRLREGGCDPGATAARPEDEGSWEGGHAGARARSRSRHGRARSAPLDGLAAAFAGTGPVIGTGRHGTWLGSTSALPGLAAASAAGRLELGAHPTRGPMS